MNIRFFLLVTITLLTARCANHTNDPNDPLSTEYSQDPVTMMSKIGDSTFKNLILSLDSQCCSGAWFRRSTTFMDLDKKIQTTATGYDYVFEITIQDKDSVHSLSTEVLRFEVDRNVFSSTEEFPVSDNWIKTISPETLQSTLDTLVSTFLTAYPSAIIESVGFQDFFEVKGAGTEVDPSNYKGTLTKIDKIDVNLNGTALTNYVKNNYFNLGMFLFVFSDSVGVVYGRGIIR